MSMSNISQKEAYKIMLKDYPDVMNVAQVCEVLGIGAKSCYRLLREEQIASLRIGKIYRIPKAHLLSYLNIGTDKTASTSSLSNSEVAIMHSLVDSNDVREE